MTTARNRLFHWLALALLGAGALLHAGRAQADELKWRIGSHIAAFDAKPVGDVEGHVAGPYVRRGLAFFPTGEVAVWTSSGTLDMVKGKGTAKGTTLTSFADGSTIATDFAGEFAPGPDGQPAYRMSGLITGGSGRFAGIRGQVATTGKAMTPLSGETRSDAYFDVTATFTIAKP